MDSKEKGSQYTSDSIVYWSEETEHRKIKFLNN